MSETETENDQIDVRWYTDLRAAAVQFLSTPSQATRDALMDVLYPADLLVTFPDTPTDLNPNTTGDDTA